MRRVYQDTIFYICLGFALAFVAVVFLGSCGMPRVDLDAVPRNHTIDAPTLTSDATGADVEEPPMQWVRSADVAALRSAWGQR